jgi:hypothetical protein
MARDAIVEEVRRIRDVFAKEHDYDVRKIARALRREEVKSGRKLVTLPPNRLREKRTKAG